MHLCYPFFLFYKINILCFQLVEYYYELPYFLQFNILSHFLYVDLDRFVANIIMFMHYSVYDYNNVLTINLISNILFIADACLEYPIFILFGGLFLATTIVSLFMLSYLGIYGVFVLN